MRKNGFTLIELLAVIVILAIIALIATPIILGIINDAREESNERSAELYLSGVELAIARRNLTEEFKPEICEIQPGGNLICDKYEDPLKVEVDGKIPMVGSTIKFDKNKPTEGTELKFEGFTASINESGKLKIEDASSEETGGNTGVVVGDMASICDPLDGAVEGQYKAGDKYECDVDPTKDGKDYIFYVLTTPAKGATSINLIMDSNIRTGGEAVKEEKPTDEQKGLVAWLSKEDYTRKDIGGTEEDWGDYGNSNKGPITAIEYLQNATSGWINVNPQTISTFTDDKGNTHNMAKTYIANARMPYYSEVGDSNGTNEYLYEYLDRFKWDGAGTQPTSNVSGLNGYWTLSFNADYSTEAWFVAYYGKLHGLFGSAIDYVANAGVRPVINLSI